ncbi:MAG: hypothetical protein D6820_08290 [Lentisphaerae bacterium]|nr:MAG: hypothetical protein D6820_08290 [Lentisphaerota bacterium]
MMRLLLQTLLFLLLPASLAVSAATPCRAYRAERAYTLVCPFQLKLSMDNFAGAILAKETPANVERIIRAEALLFDPFNA